MTKFKVGDKVKIINEEHDNYGCVTTIVNIYTDETMRPWAEVEGGLNYEMSNAPELDELEFVERNEDTTTTVKKQTQIQLSDGKMSVSHTTNCKKSRVSIMHFGTKVGKIQFKDIDAVIELLTKLKEEV